MRKPNKISHIIIPTTKVNQKKRKINIASQTKEALERLKHEKLIFSFQFLDFSNKYFGLDGTCPNWSYDMMLLLRDLSDINRNDFTVTYARKYRSHSHDWNDLEFKFLIENAEQYDCRQARISTSKGGIHGFLIGNCFYIVWLDPQHNLYPDNRYGGLIKLKSPQTCCGFRDEELTKLKKENEELWEMLERQTQAT